MGGVQVYSTTTARRYTIQRAFPITLTQNHNPMKNSNSARANTRELPEPYLWSRIYSCIIHTYRKKAPMSTCLMKNISQPMKIPRGPRLLPHPPHAAYTLPNAKTPQNAHQPLPQHKNTQKHRQTQTDRPRETFLLIQTYIRLALRG